MISEELEAELRNYYVHKNYGGIREEDQHRDNQADIEKDWNGDGYRFGLSDNDKAHLCKEWALTREYRLLSGFDEIYPGETATKYTCLINHTYSNRGCLITAQFRANTEPDAVFKAGDWLLKILKSLQINF